VDGYLVADIHLVEFVNSTYTVVCEHESAGFDGELASLFIFDYCCCETGS
jgi:hypothetical protein